MYVILRNGRVIENATLRAAGPGVAGMSFAIDSPDLYAAEWLGEEEIQTIRFDRDTVLDPPPEPGPDDFKIGTRHNDPPLGPSVIKGEGGWARNMPAP